MIFNKPLVRLTLICLLGANFASAQQSRPPRSWKFVDFALENTGNGSILMPNVIKLRSGKFAMYYNLSSPTINSIMIALSDDAIHWSSLDAALTSPSDPNDREFTLGGASVVPIENGKYRMYYRASPQQTPGKPPLYGIFSAISSDGITWEREAGVRIDIAAYDTDSSLTLAGHGSFYRLTDGRYGCIFSANTKENPNAPSDLTLALSNDGLKWGGFKTLYKGWHDPTIKRVGDRYYMYAFNLHYNYGVAQSDDGITWPSIPKPFKLFDKSGVDLGTAQGTGDFGLAVGPNGRLLLFTNYGNPSQKIAIFKPRSP